MIDNIVRLFMINRGHILKLKKGRKGRKNIKRWVIFVKLKSRDFLSFSRKK